MDSTRPTPPNGDVAGSPSRTLKTLIVYPARGKPGSVDADEPADLVKAVRDRAPVSGAERFPLLVYAHGLSGGFVSTFVTSSAAAGYVVVARAFPLSKKDAPGGPSAADYANQPGDVSFVISQMLHVPRRDHDLQRIIDPKAVGVTGASSP